jgi:hypothetical protein
MGWTMLSADFHIPAGPNVNLCILQAVLNLEKVQVFSSTPYFHTREVEILLFGGS